MNSFTSFILGPFTDSFLVWASPVILKTVYPELRCSSTGVSRKEKGHYPTGASGPYMLLQFLVDTSSSCAFTCGFVRII